MTDLRTVALPHRTYRALVRGAFLGIGPWSGRVVSVHPGALNIVREDGLLVSLVAAAGSMTAMSILAASVFEHTQLAGQSLQALVGRPAVCRHASLLISGLAPITLPLGEAWSGAVRPESVRLVSGEKALLAAKALSLNGKPGGLLGVLSTGHFQNAYVKQAMRALAMGRPAALVGLGPGMTPAGDDFLAGVLLAGSAGLSRESVAPDIDISRIEASLPGTTPAGRTLLWLALRGSFPSYLCVFVERLAGATAENEIAEAVDSACSHGETSGTDSLAGFCWMMRERPGFTVA
jgi:hypothetical protein